MEAVEVAIYKEGDGNTVAVALAVEDRIRGIKETLPEGMKLEKIYDQSIFISSAVNEVKNAGIIGGILAILVLYFFLRNFWSTVIISVSIPVSIIATFNLMYGNDITLNIMSFGGIALGIGMLVDNSIVVLENIARHRSMGKSVLKAAQDGAGEVDYCSYCFNLNYGCSILSSCFCGWNCWPIIQRSGINRNFFITRFFSCGNYF